MPKDPLLKKALTIIANKGWGHFELKDLADEKTSWPKYKPTSPTSSPC